MKVEKVSGFFDCKKYDKNKKRHDREMQPEGERVNISFGFDEENLPADFKEFAKLHEKTGKHYVSVKVFPKNCKAYSASSKVFDFPKNKDLDGNQFEMNIEYSIKHGTGTEMNGIYANRIQFLKRVDTAFEAVEDGVDDIFNSPITTQPKAVTQSQDSGVIDDGLPF